MVGTGSIICHYQKAYPFTIAVWPCLWYFFASWSVKYRQYFALLGTFGTLAAFVYPVPDAYPFPILRFCPLSLGI